MNLWYLIDLFAFLGGAVATLLITPFFQWIAVKTDFLDRPQANHKGHCRLTPLLGGAAMFTGWILCIGGGLLLARWERIPFFAEVISDYLDGISYAAPQLGFIVLGAFLSVILGLIDDKWAMSAAVKFGGQFLIALLAATLGGVRVNIFLDNAFLTTAVSIFWIMLLMNSINFSDNMDGLAVGTIAIAMGFFTVIAALNQQFFIAAFSALTCGVCCGFWFYNFNPAVIFMGDSGSHFLGYMAAVISAGVTYFGIDFSLSRFPILMPLFILALPLFDTAMVVLIRTRNRKPFWIGDHNHISHRFVRMGLSRKQAVMLVHLMALTIGLGILPVFWGDFRTAAILVVQALLLLGIITILQFTLGNRQETRETPVTPAGDGNETKPQTARRFPPNC